ncbi:MAG: Thioredoxin protein [Fluviicola sp.]|jgi:rhodanese-related sulfurtransferase|uniref:rhodanese-like domain-containing protein n=1 Tax=Fluviicola sp. TaxID=1917219 RepID=UPI002602FFDD|nr:rhodanese-like domain-containing protein [Fluviicola sp.]MDF3028739.1 Thioredoxin protein [Fluviicola sp.]
MRYLSKLTKQLTLLFFLTFTSYFFAQKIDLAPKLFYDSIHTKQAQLLDVRTSNEYAQGHISGAFQADWNNFAQFKERVASLDKHSPLYIYCLAGSRSAAAQEWLIKEGFETVINLRGGINSWNLEDLPLEGKKETEQLSMEDFLASLPPNKTVLVDFGAEWCPPCKKMNPIIDELNMEGAEIIRVDGGSQTQLVKELHVESFPTFISFKNGKEITRITGVCSKETLQKLLD